METIRFTPTPTCAKFMLSDAPIRALVGAVGSSKTTTCLYEIMRRAALQEKALDGRRYTRWAICRNTLKSMKETVLKDFLEIFGDIATHRVADSVILIDDGEIHCEILFVPLEYEDDKKRLLSSQYTGIYFNEFSEMDPDFIPAAYGRCGRYPSKRRGAPTWYGVILDSNPGTRDSPWYDMLHEKLPKTWEYFEQPAPLFWDDELEEFIENPLAENIENLPPNPLRKKAGKPPVWDYYYNLIEGATPEWVDRYVLGKWGISLEGQPVFQHRFTRDFHVVKDMELSYQHPIIIGMDLARCPAAVFGQINASGQLQIRKACYWDGIGLNLFMNEMVKPLLQESWAIGRPTYIVADPSGKVKDRSEIDDFHYLRSMGFQAFPASTNLIPPRIAAVDHWLLKQSGGKASITFHEEGCADLITAMEDKYRYKKKRDGSFDEKPDKARPWADLVDGLQYLCLGTNKRVVAQVMRKLAPVVRATPAPPSGGWC